MKMEKYVHGGNIYDNKIKYDFSANINPLGMPESVKDRLCEMAYMFEHYPDVNYKELAQRIAKRKSVSENQIVCGNGAIEIIYKAVNVIKPNKALLASPCFVEYEKALLENETQIEYYERQEKNDFKITKEYLLCLTDDIDMAILCQPNNPSGDVVDEALLKQIIEKAKENDIFLIIDECFIDFVRNSANISALKYLNYKKLLVINAFTKSYAMPGLRLGYGMCSDLSLVNRLKAYGPEWSVSVPAQIAGVEAIKCENYIDETVSYIEKEREYLSNELRALGIKVIDSCANFLMIKLDSKKVSMLFRNGIMIRDLSNVRGLCDSGYYRIAVRTHKENEELIRIIKE